MTYQRVPRAALRKPSDPPKRSRFSPRPFSTEPAPSWGAALQPLRLAPRENAFPEQKSDPSPAPESAPSFHDRMIQAMREPRRSTLQREPAREATPAVSGGGGETVQRWLDVNLLKGRTRDGRTRDLAQRANAYNSNRRSKSQKDRLNELHDLEVAIYQWLDALDSHDTQRSEPARWAKSLMNEVQREHQELVQESIDSNSTEPPVANFDQLSPKEQRNVKALWNKLRQGTGKVRITETESYTNKLTQQPESRQHPGFQTEVLAQFARLLETSTGRDIVSQIDQGKGLVTIRPGQAQDTDAIPGSEFAAGPVGFSGEDKLKEVNIDDMFKGQPNARRKRAAYKRNYFVDLDLAGIQDPKKRAKAIYDLRRQHPGLKGFRTGGKHYQFGKGTSVDVTMTRDVPDADPHHTSRMVDQAGKELIFPNFMTLGHELGHAIHMQGGVALGGVSDKLFPQVDANAKGEDWSNLEEYGTINTVENALRTEYGLTPRYGHINQPVFQKKLLEPIVNDLFTLSDEQPQAQRGSVESHITAASTSLAQLKIDDARRSTRRAVQVFRGQVQTAFPQFTQQETAQAKATLGQAYAHLDSATPAVLQQALQEVRLATQQVRAARQRVQQQAVPQAQPPQQQGGGFSYWNPFSWFGGT